MHRFTKFDVLAHAQARLPARAPGSSPQAAHRDVPAVPDRSPLLTALWPLLWRFHFFAGVVVAPFLVVLCLTGIAYALAPQLSEVVYHEQLSVDRVGRRPESLAVQVRAAQAVEPHRRLASIDPPSAPDRTTAVNFATGSRTASGLDEYRTVYVDPYTGSTHGALTTTAGRPPLQEWLRELHGQLLLGDVGRVYSELVASWLPFLASAGLLLWLTRAPASPDGRDRAAPRPRPGCCSSR